MERRSPGWSAELKTNTGADELCFLDVTATVEKRGLVCDLVESVARSLAIPFTVGGGIRSVDEARAILRAGADKIAVNSAAVADPDVVARAADRFGAPPAKAAEPEPVLRDREESARDAAPAGGSTNRYVPPWAAAMRCSVTSPRRL